jgi:hypothetical protein
MTVQYSITPKGRDQANSFGGHLSRMLKSLMVKPRTLEQLEKIVAAHSDSDAPMTLVSWYLSRAADMGYVSRKVID